MMCRVQFVFLLLLIFSSFVEGKERGSTVDDVYRLIKTRHISTAPKDLDSAAIQGMLSQLDDSYSAYISPKRYQYIRSLRNGNTVGVGLRLGKKNGKIHVMSCFPNSPAKESGLLAGDKIVSVNGQSVQGFSVNELTARLEGRPGSEVNISVDRLGYPKILRFYMQRRAIEFMPVDDPLLLNGEIAYIRIHSLEPPAVPDLIKQSLFQFQRDGVKALILDLRGNGGGLYKSGIRLAGFFYKKGLAAQIIRRRGGRVGQPVSGHAFFTDAPILVLVDEGTASSAELLAAALQENGRAVLMGTRTFGKSSVQRIFPLNNGGALVLTVAQYLTAKGEDISGSGLEVDLHRPIPESIAYEMASPHYEYSIERDYQLQEAILYMQGRLLGLR